MWDQISSVSDRDPTASVGVTQMLVASPPGITASPTTRNIHGHSTVTMAQALNTVLFASSCNVFLFNFVFERLPFFWTVDIPAYNHMECVQFEILFFFFFFLFIGPSVVKARVFIQLLYIMLRMTANFFFF